MDELIPRLKRHFDQLLDRFTCFYEYGIQVEGWFKGELLTLLSSLTKEGVIQDLDREIRYGPSKIDLSFQLHGIRHWIEIKHWLIGEQRGSTYDATFYFSDPTSVGVVKDVDKLNAIQVPSRKWLLILLTANPGISSWESGIKKFNQKFTPRHLVSHTTPAQFPLSYFLGLLEVHGESTRGT